MHILPLSIFTPDRRQCQLLWPSFQGTRPGIVAWLCTPWRTATYSSLVQEETCRRDIINHMWLLITNCGTLWIRYYTTYMYLVFIRTTLAHLHFGWSSVRTTSLTLLPPHRYTTLLVPITYSCYNFFPSPHCVTRTFPPVWYFLHWLILFGEKHSLLLPPTFTYLPHHSIPGKLMILNIFSLKRRFARIQPISENKEVVYW